MDWRRRRRSNGGEGANLFEDENTFLFAPSFLSSSSLLELLKVS